MNKQKLPNATVVLVLGILSIITCICYGIVGLTMAIIALVLYHKDIKLYQANPDTYSNYPNLSIGRVLSIIGLCLNALSLIVYVYLIAFVGEQGMRDILHNLEVKTKQQQEMSQ
ncbi:MAG: DUF4190 domain-containing protein [Flavobacterium sp.]|nr:MAG: DUF4190 domain-containing protein [Flavobacterium sp.]